MRGRLTVLMLLVAVSAATADVLRLKNGGTMVGKVVAANDKEVTFRTSAGVLTVPRANVAAIEQSEAPLDAYTRRAAELADDDVDGHFDLAEFATKQGLRKQAIAHLRQVLASQPDHKLATAKLRKQLDPLAASLAARAKALQGKGDYAQAEAPLTRLLEVYPESSHAAAAHHLLATGYAARKNYEQALVRWRRALSLDPGYAPACEGAAEACIELGDWPEAERFAHQALASQHGQSQAKRLRERLKAIQELQRLAEASKKASLSPSQLASEGRLLMRLGRAERGIGRLEDAYDAGARDPKLLAFLADYYERRGRVREALELCDALAKASPTDDGLLRRRARLERLLLVPKALATRDRRARERLLHKVAESGASFEYVEAALRQSAVREPQEPGLGEGSFVVDEVLVRARYVCYVPNGYDPRRPWPLVLALHRDGDGAKDHFYNWETVAKTERAIVMCPAAPRKSKEWKFADLPLALSALRHATKLYNVDTNRVCLAGTGSGGLLAWAVALRHPDRFAALVIRNGRLDEISRLYLPAARNLPIYQLVSERAPPDTVGSLRESNSALSRWSYAAQHEEVPGSRHPAMPELNPKIGQWLADKVRDPYAPQVRLLSFEFANAEAYWVRIDRFADSVFDPNRKLGSGGAMGLKLSQGQLHQMYMAQMKDKLASVSAVVLPGNRIRIAARHVAELTLSLSDAMVDLGKPVRVYVNGELAFRGEVERSLEHLFDSARRHGDPRMCYSASVKLQVK